jgi:type I restriction enzyme S subunit
MQVSTVRLSKVKDTSKLFRFDAEYFQPQYLKTEALIQKHEYTELRNIISLLTDYHANGSYEILRGNVELTTENEYAHMIRTIDIERDDFENDIINISEHAYNFLAKTKVYGGEIIINKIGNAGRVYLIPPIERPTSLGMNLFMIRVNDNMSNYYLFCYLAGKYGQNQLRQRITGAVPLSIDKESTRSVFVPIFSEGFQKLVAKAVVDHFEYSSISKRLFKESQSILLSEIGLTNWHPIHQLAFVKNFSETKQAERIDAEYYQPKYEALIKAIKGYKGGWDSLKNLVTLKKTVEVGSGEYLDKGIPFVRVSNLSPFEITEEKYISEKLYAEIKQHQPNKGEILFSKDATPGIAHYLDAQPQRMIPSGGILRLKSKTNKINNEYLTLVLNSLLVKEQINRDVGGSIILHWRPDQVKETIIPILAEKKQTEIQTKVIESLSLRKQSKHLLECAKRAVEIAIEQDEKTAINWLEDQIGR